MSLHLQGAAVQMWPGKTWAAYLNQVAWKELRCAEESKFCLWANRLVQGLSVALCSCRPWEQPGADNYPRVGAGSGSLFLTQNTAFSPDESLRWGFGITDLDHSCLVQQSWDTQNSCFYCWARFPAGWGRVEQGMLREPWLQCCLGIPVQPCQPGLELHTPVLTHWNESKLFSLLEQPAFLGSNKNSLWSRWSSSALIAQLASGFHSSLFCATSAFEK